MKVTLIYPDGTREQTDNPQQVANILSVGGSVLKPDGSSFYQVMISGNQFDPANLKLDGTPLNSFFGGMGAATTLPGVTTNVPGGGSPPVPGPQIGPLTGSGSGTAAQSSPLLKAAIIGLVLYVIFK